MPRGDGRKIGEPRIRAKRSTLPQPPSKSLARRLRWWEEFGTSSDSARNKVQMLGQKIKWTNYDGILDFRRPGSQRK